MAARNTRMWFRLFKVRESPFCPTNTISTAEEILFTGAGGGSRTRMELPPRDFKSTYPRNLPTKCSPPCSPLAESLAIDRCRLSSTKADLALRILLHNSGFQVNRIDLDQPQSNTKERMAFRRSTVRSRSAPPIIPRESESRFAGNYGLASLTRQKPTTHRSLAGTTRHPGRPRVAH